VIDRPKDNTPNRRLAYAGIVGNGRTCALVDDRGRIAFPPPASSLIIEQGHLHFATRGAAGIHVSVPERYQGQATELNHAH